MKGSWVLVSLFAPALFLSLQHDRRPWAPMEMNDSTRLTTFFALDPLSRTLCLTDGKPGMGFQDNEVKNRCSDIDFNAYTSGSFTVGIEGPRVGQILDLGTAQDLMKKYGYQETVGNGQGFASLRIENNKVVILQNHRTRAVQELEEGRGLFDAGRPKATAAVKLGHIYLVRLTGGRDRSSVTAKLIVVDYRPNELVTVRWQLLP